MQILDLWRTFFLDGVWVFLLPVVKLHLLFEESGSLSVLDLRGLHQALLRLVLL